MLTDRSRIRFANRAVRWIPRHSTESKKCRPVRCVFLEEVPAMRRLEFRTGAWKCKPIAPHFIGVVEHERWAGARLLSESREY